MENISEERDANVVFYLDVWKTLESKAGNVATASANGTAILGKKIQFHKGHLDWLTRITIHLSGAYLRLFVPLGSLYVWHGFCSSLGLSLD